MAFLKTIDVIDKDYLATRKMGEFRKKPVVIRACRYYGEDRLIQTLEGGMLVRDGDWIIEGVKGELYPCRDDIFRETYEDLTPPAQPGNKERMMEERRYARPEQPVIDAAIVEVKELRRALDGQLQRLKAPRIAIEPEAHRCRALAITKLQESIMWLGMELKALGTENP